jgi:hypothetical protein
MSVTPFLPQRGRQRKGSPPLTPISKVQSREDYRYTGDARAAGAEASDAAAPRIALIKTGASSGTPFSYYYEEHPAEIRNSSPTVPG